MPIDVVFPDGITSVVFYEIVNNIIIPQGANLQGHDNGIIIFISSQVMNTENMTIIINAIDEISEHSRNYLVGTIRYELREEESVSEVLSLIAKGERHIKDKTWEAVPVHASNAQFVHDLIVANPQILTNAVTDLVHEIGLEVRFRDM